MTDRGEIYIVYGSYGEYSDHTEWNVAAFTKEDRANLFKDLVTRKYNEARARYQTEAEAIYESEKSIPFPDAALFAFPEDSHAPIDSGYEATYYVTAVTLDPKF